MNKIKILWIDDEVDLLTPHIKFLELKGYEIHSSNNGVDALETLNKESFDLVFLDENMPGMSGLEVLKEIKKAHTLLPVIMITKSEEEHIMEGAIGSSIADYLIKPVNPNQILLAIKKNIDSRKIISEQTTQEYQMDFRSIGMEMGNRLDFNEWKDIYKRLVDWELRLEKSEDSGVLEILQSQKDEANKLFSSYVEKNYADWVSGNAERPIQSHTAFRDLVMPKLHSEKPTFLFMVDNLRFDQWKSIAGILNNYFRIDTEDIYFSILPTATQYARNAFFAGLLPSEIEKKYPHYWVQEHEEGTKNQYESDLLGEQLKRFAKDVSYSYNKILTFDAGKRMVEKMHSLMSNKLNVIVYNFVDTLSHARTDMEVIKELASDEKAYRSLTLSWFENSPLLEMMKFVSEKGCRMIITTDHGSIRVRKAVKVVGDRSTNTNLRYKFGRNLDYNYKDVFAVKNPKDIYLPQLNVSTSYIFCRESDYFVYPNNLNHFAQHYKETFQHGGISLEEMLIPMISLSSK